MLVNYIKRFIMSAFLIYAFNMVGVNFNVILPINVWTLAFTSFFDISGISVLLIIKALGV